MGEIVISRVRMRWWSSTTNGIGVHHCFSYSEGRGADRTLDYLTHWGTGYDGSRLGWGMATGTRGSYILALSL